MFLVATVRAYFDLKKKEAELSSLSQSARISYEGLFGQFKVFLFVTVLVAFCSISTVVLPTELMLHHWQHGKSDYAVYSKWGFKYYHKTSIARFTIVYDTAPLSLLSVS